MRESTNESASTPAPPATLRDVAKAAGVGIATVSRVLNKSPLVAPGTAERIQSVMDQLGYKASPLEKRRGKPKKASAIKHRTVSILFLGGRSLKWIINCAPIYAYAINGAEDALNSRGITCVIRNISTRAEAEAAMQLNADGFVLLGDPEWGEWPAGFAEIPGIKMFRSAEPGWYDCITYNNDTTGKLSAEYLFEQGVRRATVIGSSAGVFERRIHAFTRRMTELGGSVADLTHIDAIKVMPDMNAADQAVVDSLVAKMLRKTAPRPEGIFVTSDVITPIVYQGLNQHRLIPGKDVPIVTCNNEKPYLLPLHPRPAVVDIQAEAIGRQAIERLLWRIENPSAPRMTLVMEPKLLLPGEV